ncbi:hypothetical protein NQ314_017233 [Rhamnusium bicolor]|uniref:Tyr recombinase domain-containing protein n=1 Tax=Rhamnusium bicolor TaxID=1586634 RepID=A0AAV8WU66_9CUCU|nr:hypothetical protein NQ314_017233 [Rhamnusium bicolor]
MSFPEYYGCAVGFPKYYECAVASLGSDGCAMGFLESKGCAVGFSEYNECAVGFSEYNECAVDFPVYHRFAVGFSEFYGCAWGSFEYNECAVSSSVPENSPPDFNIYIRHHVSSSTNWGDALNNVDNDGTEETRVYKVNEKYVPIISGDVLNNVGDDGVELRNKGNFLKTANNCPRRVRQSQIPGTPVLPCDNCLGFFSSKLLYRHRRNCGEKRSGRAQSEGQTTLIRNFRTDERLKREVFPRMRADKISLEAKADSLICSFGARYLRSHREKHFASVTSPLQPKYFDLFVRATQTVAKYNPQTEVFEAPSFAMNIVNSFKQCCDIAINIALKGSQKYETVPAAEAEAQLRTMIHLFTANWRFEISSQAASNLHLNKWNKVTIVPLASDLKILRNYLLQSAKKAVDRLKINDKDVSAYNILVDTIYCRVILLNRKRPGELQRMLLHTYLSCGNEKAQYEEFKHIVTPSERVLLEKLKRVVIRGKRGRGVPVLFSVDVQNNIEFMLEYRSNFVPKENLYLFAKANSKTEISGYKMLNKYAQTCGAKNPTAITSTRLRKHLATLTQIFNMTDSDIEQLAAFMGHTPGVHRGSYRLPDDIYQTAKLSKLLLLMEIGGAGDYKGKSLEEIDLNMEENLLDETNCDESDMDDEIDDTNTENVVETNVNEININKAVSVKPEAEMKKNKRVLIPWTSEQKLLARKFFQEHIKKSKPPKRHECEKLIENHPQAFNNKNWLKIKVFIQNIYNQKQRQDD